VNHKLGPKNEQTQGGKKGKGRRKERKKTLVLPEKKKKKKKKRLEGNRPESASLLNLPTPSCRKTAKQMTFSPHPSCASSNEKRKEEKKRKEKFADRHRKGGEKKGKMSPIGSR